MLQKFTTAQQVIIELEGRSIEATIILASENGLSLGVEFDGLIGGYVRMMPILYVPDKQQYVDLLGGREVKITVPLNTN